MISLSPLPKTWIFDVDGTVVKHNGHLEGQDTLLDGVKDFFAKLPDADKVLFITAREKKYETDLKAFFDRNSIRYDLILFDMPKGERILINDDKPSGLKTAHVFNIKRDSPLDLAFVIDETL